MSKIGTPQWFKENETARKRAEAESKATAEEIVRLIQPRGDQRRACLNDAIKAAEDMEDKSALFNNRNVHLTKDTKDALRDFADAAVKLDYAVRRMQVVPFEVPAGSIEEVLAFGRRCREAADAKEKPELKGAAMKNHAVRQAYLLMRKYGVGQRPTAVSKGNTFCKTAAVLWGDAEADLFSKCKEYVRQLRRGEKVKT